MSHSFKFRITLISVFLLFAHLSIGQSLVAPVRVADLSPYPSSGPHGLQVTSGTPQRLFFGADEQFQLGVAPKSGIWMTDGTTEGTQRKANGNDDRYMIATSATHGFHISCPGSCGASTAYYTSVSTDIGGSWFAAHLTGVTIGSAVALGDKLIAAGRSGTYGNTGIELFSVQPGTAASTLLRDIRPGIDSSTPKGMMVHANRAYFTAEDAKGRELWSTDGTPAGTLMIKDIIAGAIGSEPSDMRSVGGRLYFSALAAAGDREPWTCNGTTAGTVKLKEINPSTTVGSDPKEFTAMGTKVFFSANDGTIGRELWITDGTANGTVMVKDIITGSSGSNPHDLVVFNKKLWFVASDALGRMRSLYATDGTSGGTVKMLSLPANSDGEHLNVCNGKLFYVSRDATSSKMWCTDGTAKGTKQVQPAISPNINPIGTGPMAVMGNWLYFNGNFDGTGAELWKVQ